MTDSLRWSPVRDESSNGRDAKLKELMSTLDPQEVGFALHEHYVYERSASGTTVSVPWSDFRLTVETTDETDARRAFGKAYLTLVSEIPDEMVELRRVMLAHGHVPLSDRV